MVDKPPKLIINVIAITEIIPDIDVEISIQPFVISINPSKILAKFDGNKLNIGFKEVIMTKNIAMITPTEIMLKEESTIIFERLKSLLIVLAELLE